jgi:hypothetical protein
MNLNIPVIKQGLCVNFSVQLYYIQKKSYKHMKWSAKEISACASGRDIELV